MQNDTDKFFDTYGKNTSFAREPELKAVHVDATDVSPSLGQIAKKYIFQILLVAALIGIALIGGVFIIIALAIFVVQMLLRGLFADQSGSSDLSLKK